MLVDHKKILFITGTRADFGKIKEIIKQAPKVHSTHVFVTGMHLQTKHGSTWHEVREFAETGLGQVHPFPNHTDGDLIPQVLSKTLEALTTCILDIQPDLVVVHGDRIESLASAACGATMNVRVAHIEGGEVSGTIDESLRHAITKLSHHHFVANEDSKKIILQLGEQANRVEVIGSPEVDIMKSKSLPTLDEARLRYQIPFSSYAIAILHPVTTELDKLEHQAALFFSSLQESQNNFIIIRPNNDPGHEIIWREIENLKASKSFRVFPSLRFEYYLTLLKHASFIIGNSSSGVREAPFYGTPTIDVGSRQSGRVKSPSITQVDFDREGILNAIERASKKRAEPQALFGTGESAKKFWDSVSIPGFWRVPLQKQFCRI
jgi:UDP-N-acetylglucosamine 2-epimerase (hydrolysing)